MQVECNEIVMKFELLKPWVLDEMRKAAESGGMVVWLCKGAKRQVPNNVILHALNLWDIQKHNPNRGLAVGVLHWSQGLTGKEKAENTLGARA